MTQGAQVSDNLEEWDGMGGGREVQEGGDILTPMADVWQKPTQYCKAVILQVKINFNLKAHTHTHTHTHKPHRAHSVLKIKVVKMGVREAKMNTKQSRIGGK